MHLFVLCVILYLVKYIVIECADLQVRKNISNESLYSLYWNVSLEIIFDFLCEIGVFYKIWSMLQ